jgi:hypothetical protein
MEKDMKKSLNHNRYIIGLALVALAAASILSESKAVSASVDGSVRFVSYASIGIVPEQKLRISVGNPANPRTAGSQLTFEVAVYGRLSGEATIKMLRTGTGGAIAPYDVPYSELGVEGEPGTRRVQMWVQILIEAPSGSEPRDIPVSLEIINEGTGATTLLTANRIWEYTPCCDSSY